MKNHFFTALVLAGLMCLAAPAAQAIPKGSMINMITDPAWMEVFPLRIAGITVASGDGYSAPDAASSPICVCPMPPPLFFRIGVPVSFNEPARLVETVKDPFYFPSFGFDIGSTGGYTKALGAATMHAAEGHQNSFYQGHWFVFPIWGILGLLTDFLCVEQGGIDLAFLTEILPTWQDDSLAAFLTPEVLLFANPVAQMACVADSVAANAWRPIDPMFWCIGSSGSAYPLNGHFSDHNNIQSAFGTANRLIYNMSRLLLLWDTGMNWCSPVITPIWIKSHYKLQRLRPTVQKRAWPVGTSAWMYQHFGNPPLGSGVGSADNFSFLLFRKRLCCVL
ncbi:TraU family protein [Geoalkalibacter sp.]|uniref:TraU family protein n=1 Tax=Geoalkalibacter sp. TaxID=3041440 RepID=UPI00272E8B82|nr:TraU family protein [Geoalkalibacter sp.]